MPHLAPRSEPECLADPRLLNEAIRDARPMTGTNYAKKLGTQPRPEFIFMVIWLVGTQLREMGLHAPDSRTPVLGNAIYMAPLLFQAFFSFTHSTIILFSIDCLFSVFSLLFLSSLSIFNLGNCPIPLDPFIFVDQFPDIRPRLGPRTPCPPTRPTRPLSSYPPSTLAMKSTNNAP